MLQWAHMIGIRLSDRVRPARRLGGTGLCLLEFADDGKTDRKVASGKCCRQNGEAVKVVRRLAVRASARIPSNDSMAARNSPRAFWHAPCTCSSRAAAAGRQVRSEAQGPLARRQRLYVASLKDETIGGKGYDPSESGTVVELRNLSAALRQSSVSWTALAESSACRKSMRRSIASVAPLVGRQMLDGNKRTFEMLNRDAVCCTGNFPRCCDLEMNDRPVPRLGANGVEGQPVGFFDKPIGIYLLTGNQGGGMQRAAPVRRQHPVSCVVNEPVLEPVLDVRKQVGLVEEFGAWRRFSASRSRSGASLPPPAGC